MDTPVVLIMFNRPELTRQVVEQIENARPSKLFIISDGPRTSKKEEQKLVQQTRKVVENISWPCKVKQKYSDKNLGCRESVSSGLDWVFSQVDRAIILEDDCVPNSTFFPYCEELLERYKDNKKISMISGDNFFQNNNSHFSYDFSYHSLIWGWATWRRAWKTYRLAEKMGTTYLEENYSELHMSMNSTRLRAMRQTLLGKIDTWDYIWQYAMLISNGLCIFPSNNLIQNIGFDTNATHTKYPTFHARLKSNAIVFPLTHSTVIKVNDWYEKQMEKTYNHFYILLDILRQFFRL